MAKTTKKSDKVADDTGSGGDAKGPITELVVGETYFFKTPMREFFLGRLFADDGLHCVRIVDWTWVADSGRLSEFMKGIYGAHEEHEVAPKGMVKSLMYSEWDHWPYPLPDKNHPE